MANNNSFGKYGEDLAASHLALKGYTIVLRNYRYRKSEVDIIARLGNVLVFVEVKYRSYNAFGNPEDHVTKAKAGRIITAADHYVHEQNWLGNIRFDIVSISGKETLHFEDAF